MHSNDQTFTAKESVSAVASRLRMFEDYNLAYRLQDKEFDVHYASNRAERQRVGKDTKKSREEQEIEDRYAVMLRQQQLNAIAANDARVAERLQQEIEEKEKRYKERITQLDAEYARDLDMRERRKHEERRRANIEAADEQYARELQEYYNARLRGNHHGREAISNRHETNAKKPNLIPSFITKSIKRYRSNLSTALGRSGNDSSWTDAVDERTQNELNTQISNAAAGAVTYNEPPPAYSLIDHSRSYEPDRNYPLATIATRDSSSPSIQPSSSINSHRLVGFQLPESVESNNPLSSRTAVSVFSDRPAAEVVQATVNSEPAYNSSNISEDRFQLHSQCSLPPVVPESSRLSVRTQATSEYAGDNNNNNNASMHSSASGFASDYILSRLHPTNPFLADLVNVNGPQQTNSDNNFPPPPPHLRQLPTFVYNDEFGLPPPSAYAMGLTTN